MTESDFNRENLSTIKAQLVADQKDAQETRRNEACAPLREDRNEIYRGILEEQRQTRAELRGRQAEGWDNTAFLEALKARSSSSDLAAEFRGAARDITERKLHLDHPKTQEPTVEAAPDTNTRWAGPGDVGAHVGKGALTLFHIFFRAVDGGATPTRTPDAGKNEERAAAAETTQREQRQQDSADDEWRRRNQRSIMWE